MRQANYRTWIRMSKLYIFLAIALVFLVVVFLPVPVYLRIVAGAASLPFIYITFILSYSVYQFRAGGGNYQSRIHELIVSKVGGDRDGDQAATGKILDIGTGSGSLIIKLAKAFPRADLTGIDYWGADWQYSKAQCETNAEIEGISSDRIEFRKASAAELPFRDDEFDVVASCLTFHEVKDSSNKTDVIIEALRVLKPGGQFVFMDLFLDEKVFGDRDKLLAAVREHGVSEVELRKLDQELDIPGLLLGKKVLGNAMILCGRK